MAKNIKKLFALILAFCMTMSLMTTVAFAEEDNTDIETVWHGDEITVTVPAGENGYDYYLVEVPVAGTKTGYYSYEMSNHMVTSGLLRGDLNPRDTQPYYDSEIPQLFMMVDAGDGLEDWSPDGLYSFNESNYEVLYCCDVEYGTNCDYRYKRMNLEDSDYYSNRDAAHIRAIVTNSYPYVSLEQMKKNLADDGFEYAEELTRSEVLSAVQTAIWGYANQDGEETPVKYSHTFHIPVNTNWGMPMHDFTNEMTNWWDTNKVALKKASTLTEDDYATRYEDDKPVADVENDGVSYGDDTQTRINALIDYLMDLDTVYADDKEVIITDLEIVDSFPVMAKEGVYTVALRVELNNSGSSKRDDLEIAIYVDGTKTETADVKLGTEVYDLTVEAENGQTIEVVVSGTQILPEGVYFYACDGGREKSQSMVGVASGETSVYSEANTVLDIEEDDDVITADVNLKKTNMSGKALSGAEFELYAVGEDATISVGTFDVDEDGKLTIENLLPGSYELEEITAPEGYQELDDNIEFVITEEGELELAEHKYASFKRGTLQIKNKIDTPPRTPSNPDEPEDVDIPDEDPPLAEIPELFGDDHFAYIIGRDDGLVHPEANITRAEVATIFFRLLAEEVRNALMTDVNAFSDVDKGQWYNHAISTLSSMGIVRGRDNGTYYDPDAFITRAEFAAIAARFDPTGNPEGVFFSDISGHWAEKEIIIAANNGWVEGYNGLFRPDDYITRAEAMTLVNRVLHRLPETEHDLLDYMVIWPDNMDVDAWFYLAVQEATNSHFYVRKDNPVYESWTEFRAPYDWSLLEY